MSAPDPRDPRFRSYRAAAYGLYIAVVSVFCLAIIVSVVRSVRAMSPPPKAPAEQVLSYRECLDAANSLWSQLESGREKLVSTTSSARDVDRQWMEFRTSWLKQVRESEAQCALGSRDRTALREVFRLLVDVEDRYTIHAVQYAGEVGGAVDALQAAFAQAHKNPAAGRFP